PAQLPRPGTQCIGSRACRLHGPVAQRLEPTAHNGLVGGSNPPGPTIFNAFQGRTLFDRSRMFAFSSRISLVNHWPKPGKHTSFGTRGSQTPTKLPQQNQTFLKWASPQCRDRDSYRDRNAS